MKIWFQNRRVKYKKDGPEESREKCRCLRTCNSKGHQRKQTNTSLDSYSHVDEDSILSSTDDEKFLDVTDNDMHLPDQLGNPGLST